MTDDAIPIFARLRPGADLTPAEFESYVASQFEELEPFVEDLTVTLHDVIAAQDGTYDFDATVRWRFGGFDYLTLVEAKRHSNPIKREVVQILYEKVRSVGAHKGIIVATAPYQAGAIDFAKAHGIGLVKVIEGRFTIELRSTSPQPISAEEARSWGVPDYVGEFYGPGDSPGSTAVTLITGTGELAAEALLGLDASQLRPRTRSEKPGSDHPGDGAC